MKKLLIPLSVIDASTLSGGDVSSWELIDEIKIAVPVGRSNIKTSFLFPICPNVHSLTLVNAQFEDFSAIMAKLFICFPKLKYLTLNNCNLNNEDLKLLAETLKNNSSLIYLSLENNKITKWQPLEDIIIQHQHSLVVVNPNATNNIQKALKINRDYKEKQVFQPFIDSSIAFTHTQFVIKVIPIEIIRLILLQNAPDRKTKVECVDLIIANFNRRKKGEKHWWQTKHNQLTIFKSPTKLDDKKKLNQSFFQTLFG